MHQFVQPTPVRMIGKNGPVDLKLVGEILLANAKMAGREKQASRYRDK